MTQREQAQHSVIHGELALALEFAFQSRAIAAQGLRASAEHGADQRGCTEGDAADQQIDAHPGGRTRRHTAADIDAELLEGFWVEQIVAPATVEQGQVAGLGVVLAEGVQAQQGFHTALFALANGLMQVADCTLFQHRLRGHATAAGGAVQQQFGDQSRSTAFAQLALRQVIVDQPLQLRASLFLQQRQAVVQAAFAIQRRRHAVETHQGMQAEAGQGIAPILLAVLAAADEVQHRQQGPAAHAQHR